MNVPRSTAASLLSLPVELHEDILKDLNIFDKHALRGTCTYFRSWLEPFITLDSPITLEKLYDAAYTWDHARYKLEVENVIQSRYVCTHCKRLLPRTRFGDDAFCLHTKHLFCVRCGTAPMKINPYNLYQRVMSYTPYKPGDYIKIERQPYVVCTKCKKLHRGDICEPSRGPQESDAPQDSDTTRKLHETTPTEKVSWPVLPVTKIH